MMSLYDKIRSSRMDEVLSSVSELSSIPVTEAIDFMKQLSLETDPNLRSRAVAYMAKISTQHAEALALQFLSDVDPGVRFEAIFVLRKLGSSDAIPLIAHLLATDNDELVRSWAALTLGDIGDASVLPILITAVERDTGADHEGRLIKDTAMVSIQMIKSRLPNQR